MTIEKINRINGIGGEFWVTDDFIGIIAVIFPTIRECFEKSDIVCDINIEIEDTDNTLVSMPKSIVVRRRYARPATREELLSY